MTRCGLRAANVLKNKENFGFLSVPAGVLCLPSSGLGCGGPVGAVFFFQYRPGQREGERKSETGKGALPQGRPRGAQATAAEHHTKRETNTHAHASPGGASAHHNGGK